MSKTNGNIVEHSTQYIDNMGFNADTKLKSVEIGGTDGATVNRVRVNSDGSIATSGSQLKSKIDNPSTGIYYIGKAAPGTATSTAAWQIKKLDTNTLALDKGYADGSAAFDKVWDNRATGYTYS